MAHLKKMEAVLTSALWALSFSLFNNVQIVLSLSEESYPITSSSWDVCLPNKKVVGGEQIDITEAPFTLQLEPKKVPHHTYCGATVLSEEVALTAAHCVEKDFPIRLRSGITPIDNGNVHDVKKVIIHGKYNSSRNSNNDIALMFVKNPFIFSDYVQPIKLPTGQLDKGTFVMIAGYGETIARPPKPPKLPKPLKKVKYPVLRKVIVPIIDRKTCNDVFKKKYKEIYNKTVKNVISKKMICAGYPGGKYDACLGDSGGPLYLNKTIYGVVSWGLGCAQECLPGVYTNVYKFLDWINKTIDNHKGR